MLYIDGDRPACSARLFNNYLAARARASLHPPPPRRGGGMDASAAGQKTLTPWRDPGSNSEAVPW
jgi:hypothetical protein